ncbi:MAG: NAD(P)-dependent oxidoreductase [Roseomonas sp.]|nr:NAD(P)-dependent oxidoreductase [Roseomonas sp.]MCA3370106.1 NAD(P)-dependent oxidoreductase [Roseomonas sp.]
MVAVIGLGNMGMAMLKRLLAMGHQPRAWDLDPTKRDTARQAGAMIGADLAGSVADMTILSLPHDAAVAEVLAPILPALPQDAVIIDTSTLSPRAVRGFTEQAKAQGVFYLDAPVSGGPAGAAAGSMAMMVGGDAAALERATPILQHLTARLLHIGPSGAGQVAKLVNNLLVASHLVTAGEALRLGAAAGVAPEALLPLLNGASGRSAVTEVNWPRWIIPGSFDSGFSAGLMRKDVGLALELARELDVTLEATGRAAALWQELREAVPDDADFNRLSATLFAGVKP